MTDQTRPQIVATPPPWKNLPTWPVGGLFQVGYAADADLLLVLSSNGRGVFDGLTGAKIARDYQEAHDFFDPVKLTAQGFGALEGQTIRMAGLFGGGLPLTTLDGWGLEEQSPAWPIRSVFLSLPDGNIDESIADDGACALRAFGFSETGRSFIVASSCDLMIFTRMT